MTYISGVKGILSVYYDTIKVGIFFIFSTPSNYYELGINILNLTLYLGSY